MSNVYEDNLVKSQDQLQKAMGERGAANELCETLQRDQTRLVQKSSIAQERQRVNSLRVDRLMKEARFNRTAGEGGDTVQNGSEEMETLRKAVADRTEANQEVDKIQREQVSLVQRLSAAGERFRVANAEVEKLMREVRSNAAMADAMRPTPQPRHV